MPGAPDIEAEFGEKMRAEPLQKDRREWPWWVAYIVIAGVVVYGFSQSDALIDVVRSTRFPPG